MCKHKPKSMETSKVVDCVQHRLRVRACALLNKTVTRPTQDKWVQLREKLPERNRAAQKDIADKKETACNRSSLLLQGYCRQERNGMQ
jgi:hypothetical protein